VVKGYEIRPATLDDLEVVLHHRRRMFEDMGYTDAGGLERMVETSRVFLGKGLSEGTYRGWLVSAEGTRGVVAGGGVVSLEFQPHPVVPTTRRSWIVNMYTEPPHRRRGLARFIVQAIVTWCREAGLPAVFLHASDDGKPLYASLGFQPTSEMVMDLRKG
jgi:GNAT superfamily N-acetyltransferase